jgi:hypothetical protein
MKISSLLIKQSLIFQNSFPKNFDAILLRKGEETHEINFILFLNFKIGDDK